MPFSKLINGACGFCFEWFWIFGKQVYFLVFDVSWWTDRRSILAWFFGFSVFRENGLCLCERFCLFFL